MFDENFSFGSCSRSPSWTGSDFSSTREPSRSVSPCSPMSAFPPPQGYSVTDLAADLDRQRIRPDARICYQSCESYANTTDDDAAWDIPPICSDSEGDSTYSGSIARTTSATSLARMPARSYSPTRRNARQSGTRMLCASSNHAKDIAALVSRMVSSSDQCSVTQPPDSIPRTAASSDEEAEDEGYNSSGTGDDSRSSARRDTLTRRDAEYRRALDARRIGGAPAIAKEIRFRDRGHKKSRHSGGKGGLIA